MSIFKRKPKIQPLGMTFEEYANYNHKGGGGGNSIYDQDALEDQHYNLSAPGRPKVHADHENERDHRVDPSKADHSLLENVLASIRADLADGGDRVDISPGAEKFLEKIYAQDEKAKITMEGPMVIDPEVGPDRLPILTVGIHHSDFPGFEGQLMINLHHSKLVYDVVMALHDVVLLEHSKHQDIRAFFQKADKVNKVIEGPTVVEFHTPA